MCGIAGFIDSSLSTNDGGKLLNSMLEKIAHRGPDARGIFNDEFVWLGHNRLSIIDLSNEANQPFHFENLSIIFNGEIYNYIEIKRELHQLGISFRTQSDTEVIVAAYKMWGADCVKKFMGMWAFVIYDKQKKEIFCSRDRFGIKPFYYIFEGDKFYFASEYKALKQSPVFKNDFNLSQISRGLQMGWVCYNDETYFEKIKSLPPAHNLQFQTSNFKLQTSRFWDIETGKYSSLTFEEKKNKFYELFAESVRMHMRADVPVASCLSGGLDSSSIVSMVQYQNKNFPYKTFSIYYDGKNDVDERPYVKEVIKKYPSVEPFYLSPAEKDIQEHFHNALYHSDVPCTGSSFISQYFLMKLIASQKIKVVLDGQGADEYLAGYMHTYYRLVADLLKKFKLLKAFSLTRETTKVQGKKFMPHFIKSLLSTFNSEQSLYSIEYFNYYPFLTENKSATAPFNLKQMEGSKTDNFLYHLIFNTSLPSLLHYEDRNSMAFSIESRVPFLDHRLVEFCFSLLNEDKANGIFTKWIIRHALKDILPHDIAWRKDKKGFVTPGENKWLRGPLKHLVEIDFSGLDFLDKKKIKNIVDEYNKGDNSKAIMMWRLGTLNYWMKSFA